MALEYSAARGALVSGYARAFCRAAVALTLLLAPLPMYASDHADPVDIWNRKRLEGGITDLFFFPRTDEQGVRRMELILCVRRALTEAGSLILEPYTYTIYMDLKSTVTFDNDEQLKRYGGTVVRPDNITPTVTIPIRLTDKAELAATPKYEGLAGDLSRIKIATGIFDDPFIFPTFFGTNIVGMILSIPLDAFPPDQENWVLWATSTENGKQVDHVGRSLRTQNPRFDMLNTLPPNQHVKAIAAERLHPSLMRDLALRINLQGTFAFRDWDEVPDVMLYSKRSPVGFPNGRLLTDDVAERLATYGDTLLKEISYITGKWPRATKNDMPFRLTAATCRGAADPLPPQCDQSVPENLAFPYLADPWPEKKGKPPYALTEASQLKLWGIALAIVILLVLENWLVALWYHRKKLRERFL